MALFDLYTFITLIHFLMLNHTGWLMIRLANFADELGVGCKSFHFERMSKG